MENNRYRWRWQRSNPGVGSEKVYKPDPKNKWDKLYNKPGYDENDL